MMTLINPVFAQSAEFQRPVETSFGEVSYSSLGMNQVVVALNQPSVAGGDPGSAQIGMVFTPRGLDRREGDRFVYGGQGYELVGDTRGDFNHPFTGDDFGWVSHAIKRAH